MENYISTPSWRKKDGEARHRVMFDAGHLALECGSAMVLLLLVMDEALMRMVKPAFRQASTTPMSMLRTSFRHHDRFSTVHQLAMLNCGTANTVSKLLLSGTHPKLLVPCDMSFTCPCAAAAVCSLTELGLSQCFPPCDLIALSTDIFSAVQSTRGFGTWRGSHPDHMVVVSPYHR